MTDEGEFTQKVANNATGLADIEHTGISSVGSVDHAIGFKSDGNDPAALHPRITCWEY